jgi:malate dehydrogenase (oxaloacetate-decarboxylating)(NADP+)
MMQLGHKTTDLDRYIYLNNLLDHNETLFYRAIMSDPAARFLPIVYDPTIWKLASNTATFTASHAACISITRRGKVKEVLKNWPERCPLHLCHGWRAYSRSRDIGANGAPSLSASSSCTPLALECRRNT